MRQFAKEKLRHWLRVFFHTQDSAERTALAFAVGVFIAFLPPIFWLHTLLALGIAFLFRLNRLAILAGTYANTPITIIPVIWAEVRVGQLFLPHSRQLRLPRHLTSFEGWRLAFIQLKPFVPPFMLGASSWASWAPGSPTSSPCGSSGSTAGARRAPRRPSGPPRPVSSRRFRPGRRLTPRRITLKLLTLRRLRGTRRVDRALFSGAD
jgi:uncharacterized protein (DUF2062 family)